MNESDYRISMRKMRFFSHIGVFEEEKINGQNFDITVNIYLSKCPGAITDDINMTVSYADIYELIKTYMKDASCDLIEHAAYDIGKLIIRSSSLIKSAEVIISKPECPIEGDFETMEVGVVVRK